MVNREVEKEDKNEGGGILEKTDSIIDGHIKYSDRGFRHGIVGKKLTACPPGFFARDLINGLIEKIQTNLERAHEPTHERDSGTKPGKGKRNWREKSPDTKHDKRKPERECEHTLANIIGKGDPKWTWWNQMPIASGLVKSHSDKTRAVDLVCKGKGEGNEKHYKLVELKLNRQAGSPLFAMMEILRYGLIYFVLRKNQHKVWQYGLSPDTRIFEAKQIDLCVLAPWDYFDGYEHLGWLENELSDALAVACHEEFGGDLKMSLTSYRPPCKETLEEAFIKDWKEAYQMLGSNAV